ncbi:VCBS repeat protein [Pontibacter ummariensis]|uniref:Repeat domain-containing protein n=1 Tax=Pontibacter ummariensis TaxID=1610492 RepID=A0A239B6Y7_9BACT|nr:VCBS repeat-containing protein [Pontibacter ummariensis]PRY16356.1 VCBS repeat protein [Pontibacter ummariensis]SNS03695.1 Repeat domain-containing protein [Pontibacter ummariensis]
MPTSPTYKFKGITLAAIALLAAACSENRPATETTTGQAQAAEPTLFQRLPDSETGVSFANTLTETPALNVLEFEYFYNGGGVAVGDFNNDGQQDIFFAGNMVPSRLYLNKGNLKFEDITEQAGIRTSGRWASGVAVADVNNDGYQDIYVCVTGRTTPDKRKNLLYINNQDNTFTEAAQQYGLDDSSYSTHAAFFDYDKDGDLDLYLLNHTLEETNPNLLRPQLRDGSSKNTDKLYRNNGNNTFTDVSKAAGILVEGHGLGVAISDINQDGWPDVYVSNDYLSNDALYLNNGNGTFTDRAAAYFKHQSQSAMGNDVADFNNDGLVDIITVDMLPEDNLRTKLMFGGMNYDRFMAEIQNGYTPQYMRNTLQLNNGNGTFSEIGQLAGVHSTDWSWSPLLADFDNDGYKDLHITNGFPKDITNRDFIMYRMQGLNSSVPLDILNKQLLEVVNQLPNAEKSNYMYRNKGDFTFSNETKAWGLETPSFSNGAAYADLDGDGDLDLVTNNINGKAFVYRNNAQKQLKNNFLRIKLQGDKANAAGYGAKVKLIQGDKEQYQEHSPYRGFMSTVEPYLHFGLGQDATVTALEVTWPDGKVQRLEDVKGNQVLTLHHQDAVATQERTKPSSPLFHNASPEYRITYTHIEEPYIDFKIQPLLPHKYSQNGPGISVGDVNGDNLEDFYVGGAFKYPGRIFLQSKNGTFTSTAITDQTKYEEDMGSLFFDADGDGDLDLYVVSGGSEFPANSQYYQDKLYKNDGKGRYTLDAQALPNTTSSGSFVTAADMDGDGDLDLFVGGRMYPQHYPAPAVSYVLLNEGGKFRDATKQICPELYNLGMLTAALWTDFDNDRAVDLIVTGEGMPITFFRNVNGKLQNVATATGLPNTSGWWNSLAGGDLDNDGDIDYIAGNLGLNTKLKASDAEPVSVYAADYDNNGSMDPILAHYVMGKNVPARPRDDIFDQMVSMRRRFTTYESYARASVTEVLLPAEMQRSYVLRSVNMQTSYIENLGGGKFQIKALPMQAQFAPVFGITINDYDGDGNLDALLSGNSQATEVISGAYDAFTGLLLKGNGKGEFQPVSLQQSGFLVDGDAKGMAELMLPDGRPLVLAANNNGPLQAYTTNPAGRKGQVLTTRPSDARVEISLDSGKKLIKELYYGSGYLSQSSRNVLIPQHATSVVAYDFKGASRKIK